MQITLHKGTKEIGGTCIEVRSNNQSLLLDIGQPLSAKSQPTDLSRLDFSAVLVSHSHQDHYGLIENVDPAVPIYMGALGRDFINATRLFLGKEPLRNNMQTFSAWRPFMLGDIKITPYLVDHSAADAYAFLLEAGGKRIFYSGDFRGHGNKQLLFDKMIAQPPGQIDVLLMEGTMLHRDNTAYPQESAVKEAIQEAIAGQGNISFLISSSQNIDRIVSAYKACLKTGKILVVDLYTAWILELAQKTSYHVPSLGCRWPQLKVLAMKRHNDTLNQHPHVFAEFKAKAYRYRVTSQTLRDKPADYLVLAKHSLVKFIRSFKTHGPVNILYSQWRGYLEAERLKSYADRQFVALQNDAAFSFSYPHTSGHATTADLKLFAGALQPKMLIPIHTEYPADYRKHFANVRTFEDGNSVTI